MKNQFYGILVMLTVLLASCNVQERIVFNDDMGGRYESIIDLSGVLAMTKGMTPEDPEKELKKMDSLITFNEILETHKDSIASLPQAEREKLEAMRGMTLRMKMDEENSEMTMTIAKDFKEFKDIERIAYDVDGALDSAKDATPNGNQAGAGGGMPGMSKVIYTFTDNTFRRTDPKSLTQHIEDEALLSEKTKLDLEELENEEGEASSSEDMMTQMLDQMGEQLEGSTMTLEYVFPRKVVSVSPEGAIISPDGKTVTFKTDWKTLLEGEDKVLENFEVVLEEE